MVTVRSAGVADAMLITAHRRAMFASMPNPQDKILDAMSCAFEPWVRERIAEEKYLGWIA